MVDACKALARAAERAARSMEILRAKILAHGLHDALWDQGGRSPRHRTIKLARHQ